MMKTITTYYTQGNILRSVLLFLPMGLLIFVSVSQMNLKFNGVKDIIAFFIAFLFFSYLFFMMLYTGKTDKYRAAGFVTFALLFSLTFIVNLLKTRGTNTFNEETILACEVPMCNIPMIMLIIPAALTKTIIFPGNIYNMAFAFIGFIVISIALGRANCSWICFFGGWDEGASRIFPKPIIKRVNSVFRWTSFAILLIVVLWSAIALTPTYCWWLCPFKAVTEYEEVSSLNILLKTIVFVLLFIGLVIILPILTKKRLQCTTLCPMGAFLSLTNKINIFDVRIDKEKCTNCGICVKVCPTLSIDQNSIKTTHVSMTCTKCGKCIDACKQQAIQYHIKRTSVCKNQSLSRYLFLFPAFLVFIAFAGSFVRQGTYLIINLVTTGGLM